MMYFKYKEYYIFIYKNYNKKGKRIPKIKPKIGLKSSLMNRQSTIFAHMVFPIIVTKEQLEGRRADMQYYAHQQWNKWYHSF